MEAYIRQKRATPGMIQASDLQMRPMSGATSIGNISASAAAATTTVVAAADTPKSAASIQAHRNGREIHAYDGPMQFMMSPNNPDQLLPASMPTSPSSEGEYNSEYESVAFKLWLTVAVCG